MYQSVRSRHRTWSLLQLFWKSCQCFKYIAHQTHILWNCTLTKTSLPRNRKWRMLNTLLLHATDIFCELRKTERDRKCTYSVTSEAGSDTLSVKLMNGMAMASLPWQPRRALFSEVGGARHFQETHLGVRVKYLLFVSHFNQNWTLSTCLVKLPNIDGWVARNMNCHENPSSGSRVVSCEHTDGRTGRQVWQS
jgi:hypothetical protein